MPKPEKPSELVAQTRATLVERFPNCFHPKGSAKKPLKVKIREDLYERCPDIPADLLRKALADYVLGPSYQVTLLEVGAARVDLDGNFVGSVTESQSALAATRLQGRPRHAVRHWLDQAGVVLPPKAKPAEAFAATG